MNVIQCFLPGAKHNKDGVPCSCRTFRYSEDGVQIIALAEGPENGNVNASAESSDYLCRTMAVLFCKNFDKYYANTSEAELKKIISAVCLKALQKKAQEFQVDDIKSVSSALLVVAVKGTKAVTCHFGDGVIGAVYKNGLKVIACPKQETFDSSSLLSQNLFSRSKFDIKRFELTDEVSFFLMNKGISDFAFDAKTKNLREITLKMAGLVNKENGEQILKKIVSDYIIDRNPNSDDCAFTVLSLSPENAEIVPAVSLEKSEILQAEYSDSDEGAPDFPEQEYDPYLENEFRDDRDDINVRRILKPVLIPAAVAVLLILAAVLFIIFRPDLHKGNKSNNTTTPSTSSSVDDITEEETEYIPAIIWENTTESGNDFNILGGIKKIEEIYKEHGASTVPSSVTEQPSVTEKPTVPPTVKPTEKPTEKPTVKPTVRPTERPTEKPTEKPTVPPTEPVTAPPQEPVTTANSGEPVQNPAENE